MRSVRAGPITVGPDAGCLTLIAGPCVAESRSLCMEVAVTASAICRRLGVQFVFKASFDKANRTSGEAYRGPGLDEGMSILADVKARAAVPVCTDIHEPAQAAAVAPVADVVQIPAFLCRQTDLLAAAARTGRCVNIKKGQFMAPLDMRHVIMKVRREGNDNILLTERGVSFGYRALVVDFTSIPSMRDLGCPVCLDATHAVQRPGAGDGQSGGERRFIVHLARAAAAVGIDALFLEVHPDPDRALSDSASMLPLADLGGLLQDVAAIDAVVRAAEGRAQPASE